VFSKINAQPQQVPYASCDKAAGIDLAMQNPIAIQTSSRSGAADLVDTVVMPEASKNGDADTPLFNGRGEGNQAAKTIAGLTETTASIGWALHPSVVADCLDGMVGPHVLKGIRTSCLITDGWRPVDRKRDNQPGTGCNRERLICSLLYAYVALR